MPKEGSAIPVGRLLRANAIGFVLGCRVRETDAISFGGLVRVQAGSSASEVFGLVYDITIADDLMVRQLSISDGMSEEQRLDQLERRQVPIEMSVLCVGYRQGGAIHRRIPPRPPLSLHRVMVCSPNEVREFTSKLGYFRLLLRQRMVQVPVDQLMVAHVAQAYTARDEDDVWLQKASAEIIAQLRDDYATLLPLLEALGEAIPQFDRQV